MNIKNYNLKLEKIYIDTFQNHGLDLTVPQAQIDIVENDLN